MKKLIGSVMMLLILGSLPACRNSLDPEEEGNYRIHKEKEKPVMKTLRLQFGGDYVSETEEPLLRADDAGETYVGLNVYRTEKDKEGAKEEKYAYGMFIGKDGISINVITGYTYRFEASILIEDEDKLQKNSYNQYNEPFKLQDASSSGFANAWGFKPDDLDDFLYTYLDENKNNSPYFCQLSLGTAYVWAKGMKRSMFYPRVKRFYGTLDSFDPALLETIEIPMEYKSFGLKFILESIPANTKVTVVDYTDYNNRFFADTDPEYFLLFPDNLNLSSASEESKTWEGIYSLNNLKQNAQEFRLRFTWDKGNGETKSFNHTFTVTAKKKKVLKLNIEGDVNETKSGNIIFTNMDDDLEEEDPEIIDKKYN